MDKKWSIMDKKDVSDKCCQMENAIWNIFQSPSSWINGMNGFIRLVSMDGTWYHHRATDVFIPMTQIISIGFIGWIPDLKEARFAFALEQYIGII